ncbi:MAG: DNA mismatch repair protein MutT [Blastocatellia bacterium AA13]|nr:MAG: DNA mismatch repair protein MutT [Blastocatellia bacterium AA13]
MTESSDLDEEEAAGGLVVRVAEGEGSPESRLRILLIHRPKYNDWSFPKGKLNPNEEVEAAALREVLEETGIECRIVCPFTVSRYKFRRRKTDEKLKAVHYFLMEPLTIPLNVDGVEVDAAEWLAPIDAAGRLTYRMDRETLDSLLERGHLIDDLSN